MLVITTENLKPGTMLLPVQTEGCPQPWQLEQLLLYMAAPGEFRGDAQGGRL